MRFCWLRLRGVPREAARGCLEVDSDTFMLDDLNTIPMALLPYVEAGRSRSRRRDRRRHRFAFILALAAALAMAAAAWLL
jgi:hypothetical protein